MTSPLERTSKPDGSGPQNSRAMSLPSLTGMRFAFAVLVFLTNATVMGYFASQKTSNAFTLMVRQGGYAGIIYFFILSGFVLTWTARPGERAGAFWRRRFFRIYPAYAVAMVLGWVLTIDFQGAVFSKKWVIQDIFMVQSWWPDIETRSNTVAPLWSISVEAFFYLCFPLLLPLISRIRTERLWAWAIGVMATICVIPFLVKLLPPGVSYPDYFTDGTEVWLIHQIPATRLLEFVLGMLLARIVANRLRLPVGLGGAVALSAVTYWLATYLPGRFQLVAIMVVPLALVVAAGANQDLAGRRSFISGRVWVWLGKISYSFFVLQWLVLMFGFQWIADNKPLGNAAAFGIITLLFVVTLVLAWPLHVLVERPLMRRFSRPRRKGVDGSASVALSAPAGLPGPDVVDDGQETERRAS